MSTLTTSSARLLGAYNTSKCFAFGIDDEYFWIHWDGTNLTPFSDLVFKSLTSKLNLQEFTKIWHAPKHGYRSAPCGISWFYGTIYYCVTATPSMDLITCYTMFGARWEHFCHHHHLHHCCSHFPCWSSLFVDIIIIIDTRQLWWRQLVRLSPFFLQGLFLNLS